jgi:tetratricopeptide (TPR) repeat protein
MLYRCIIIGSLLCLSACTFPSSPRDDATGSGGENPQNYVSNLTEDERIALAKKRRSYITGIRKGDFYSLRNAPEDALSYYLTVAEKIPNDPSVRKKIAHVYALMKNWPRAYAEYIKVPMSELDVDETQELLHTLFFDETTFDRLGELTKLGVSSGALEYLEAVDICYSTIHNCIVHIESYTGSEDRIIDLQNQIKKSQKISPDYQYRNLLVAAKYYEQGMYRATETLLREILKERPDYIEAKKIL